VLGDCRGFVFDLDGCVWQGSTLLPGAGRTLTALHRAGRGVAFLTNNSRATGLDVRDKLQRLGLGWVEHALTPLEILGQVIAERYGPSRVLVIGAGQSAVEIATELSRVAARTMVSVRGGAYVIPRHLFGRPFDLLDIDLLNRLPWRFLNWLFAALVQVGGDGAIASYGPRGPAHRILEQVPVVSSDLVSALRGGAVVVRPAIDALDGAQVRFVDGAVDAVDAIICATGYRISLPFLSSAVFHADGVAVPLYRRIVAPNLSGLYFIGLVDAPGGLLPIVETQAAWLADVLQGIITLPETPAMWRAIDAAERRSRERFPLEPRHSIRCDPHAYVRLLVRDRRDARRARRRAGAVGRRDRDILRAQPPSSRLLCRSGSGRPR